MLPMLTTTLHSKQKRKKLIKAILFIEIISTILFLFFILLLPKSVKINNNFGAHIFVPFIISFGILNIFMLLFYIIRKTYKIDKTKFLSASSKKHKVIFILLDISNAVYSFFITTNTISFILNILTYNLERTKTQDIITLLILTLTIISATYIERLKYGIEKEKFQRQASENYVKLLKSQFNPHFLFNTLNSLAELIRKSPQHAENIVLSLADYYRTVLKSPNVWTLKEELRFIGEYVNLEKNLLYHTTFEFIQSSNIPENFLENIIVPSMVLQPLVENAIKYGVKSTDGGTVKLTVDRSDQNLIIKIENTVSKKSNEKDSIEFKNGLVITCERVKLLMGGKLEWKYLNPTLESDSSSFVNVKHNNSIICFYIIAPLKNICKGTYNQEKH